MSIKRFSLLFFAFFGVVFTTPEVLSYPKSGVVNRDASLYSSILNPSNTSVSLDLKGYVDPEVNIERIDKGTTLDIFKNNKARFKVTCNNNKTVVVTFNTKNNWKLLSKDGNSISYEGRFKGENRSETVNEEKNAVDIHNYEFANSEYKFDVSFKSNEKNLKAGEYYDRITISVSTEY